MIIREMAYAGSLGVRRGAPSWGTGNIDLPPNVSREEMSSRAERFASSKFFESQALKLFGNIPFPVWSASIIGGIGVGMNLTDSDDEDYVYPASEHFQKIMMNDRIGFCQTFPDGIEALSAAGFERIDEINPGDLVIVGVSAVVSPGFNATPWITLHAFFDADYSEDAYAQLCPSYVDIYRVLSGDSSDPVEGIPSNDYHRLFGAPGRFKGPPIFTMGSARGKEVSGRDALSECLVQEILDKRKLRLSWDLVPPDLLDAAHTVERIIKDSAVEFKQNARGLTIVAIVI